VFVPLLAGFVMGLVVSALRDRDGKGGDGAAPGPGEPGTKPGTAEGVAAGAKLAELTPKPGKPVTAQRIRSLGDLLDKVWPDLTNKPPPMPPPAKMIALAQAAAEGTGYGQGWEMTGNVGSYQCGGAQQATSFYDCVPHVDSRPQPDGSQKQYTTTFRKYKDGPTPDGKSRSALEAGAWDFLRSIAVKPFPALDELLAGDLLGYARRQYGQHYFEGFNLSAAGQDAYKESIALLVKGGVPVRKSGETPEMVAGRIVFYAAAMARSLPEIAAGLGYDTVPVRVPADLVQPWKPAFQASAKPAGVAGVDELGGVLEQLGATDADSVVSWSGRARWPAAA